MLYFVSRIFHRIGDFFYKAKVEHEPKSWEHIEHESIRRYLKERLEDQKAWYSRKANHNKKWFMRYQTLVIILGAIIPLSVVCFEFWEWPGVGVFSAITSSIITIVAGIDKLENPQTNWYNYRANEEKLKKEGFLYEYKAGSYADLNPNERKRMLVENVENIVSSDVVRFVQHQKSKEKEKKEKEENTQNQGNLALEKDKNEDERQ